MTIDYILADRHFIGAIQMNLFFCIALTHLLILHFNSFTIWCDVRYIKRAWMSEERNKSILWRLAVAQSNWIHLFFLISICNKPKSRYCCDTITDDNSDAFWINSKMRRWSHMLIEFGRIWYFFIYLLLLLTTPSWASWASWYYLVSFFFRRKEISWSS